MKRTDQADRSEEQASNPDPDMKQLLADIQEAQAREEECAFKITKVKLVGFAGEVMGLPAFAHFNHFSWSYPSHEYWRAVADTLVGHTFPGKIFKLQEHPLSISLDLKDQEFEKVELQTAQPYRGVVVQKSTYGLFIDIGLHFDWKYGSLIGLLHKFNIADREQDDRQAGSLTSVFFLEYTKDNKIALGDHYEKGKAFKFGEHPLDISSDLRGQEFEKVELQTHQLYQGVVVRKNKHGLLIDIGLHFDWKYGSLIGFLHKSNIVNPDVDDRQIGDIVSVFFLAYVKGNKIALGDHYEKVKVFKFRKHPPSIPLDLQGQEFEKVELQTHQLYQGVVVLKAGYGLFIDIGLHFDWKYGSLIGLLHKSNIVNPDVDDRQTGDIVSVFFLEYVEDDKIALGDHYERIKSWDEEMGGLIGSIQKVQVSISEKGYREYTIAEEIAEQAYSLRLPVTKIIYPDTKNSVKKFVKSLKGGEVITCEVIDLHVRKKYLVLKLIEKLE